MYINDVHYAIKFSQSFHFANDTCLLNILNNRSLNKDLKGLSFWLNANKTALLNVAKTEFILFKAKNPALLTQVQNTNNLRYLGIEIDKNLNWKIHIHELTSKLNRDMQY